MSSVLPLCFQQVAFYFCLELTGVLVSEESRERRRERAAKPREGQRSFLSAPHAPSSPFASGSRVTSRDSPKWRACSQAFPKHLSIRLALVLSKQ